MPVISKTQFIQLADRLAATYGLLVQAEQKFKAAPEPALYQEGQAYPARLLLDLTGTGTQILLTAKTAGASGNSICFSVVLPSTPSAVLASNSVGTNLILSLATDANGKANTIVEDAVTFLQATPAFTNYINIIYPVSGTGGYVRPQPMMLLFGGIGTGTGALPLFTIMAVTAGTAGNTYTLTINQPTGNSQPFNVSWNRTDLVIDLPTDGAGHPKETLGELQTDLAAATSDFVLITNSPTVLAPAVALTPFSGGGVGSYAQVVLTPPPGSNTADPDVAMTLIAPAQALDVNFTAVNLGNGVGYLDAFQGALAQHFILVGYSGGMSGFMTDNNILVHKNFSTLTFNRTGNTNNAVNVFRPDQVVLGTIAQGPSAVTFTAGTPLGTGQGAQSATNYGPQSLVAVLAPENGTSLLANWTFTLGLVDNTGTVVTSDPINFTAGAKTGAVVPITAGASTKFYAVNAATQVTAGTNGDSAFITQVVERQITL